MARRRQAAPPSAEEEFRARRHARSAWLRGHLTHPVPALPPWHGHLEHLAGVEALSLVAEAYAAARVPMPSPPFRSDPTPQP